MMKIVAFAFFVMMSNVALVFADPIVVPFFYVEGARIVSEGAYFWLKIVHLGLMEGPRGLTMLHPSDFLVRAVYINNEFSVNGTECTINDTALCVWNLNGTDEAEILLSAPYLGINETTRRVIQTFFFTGGEERPVQFEMSIISFEFLSNYYTIEHDYGELLAKNSDLNQTVGDMQHEVDLLSSKNADLNQTLARTELDIHSERNRALTVETVLFCVVIVTSITTLYYAGKRKARARTLKASFSTVNS
jgi:hypothetical protein